MERMCCVKTVVGKIASWMYFVIRVELSMVKKIIEIP